MEISHLQKLTIPVADQDKAKAFYVDTLGFEVRNDTPLPMGNNARWIEVAPAGGQASFVLCNWMPDAPHVVNVMLQTKNTDADVESLRQAGLTVDDPMQTPWGKQATFSDPDGNTFVLTDGAS
ncbi:glyoxalase [Amycolatopsis vastitatis]|uniref:Glyoxalase n=2 Tax=Amycolatopsis vastitatis TaxID=1905142 RepID=A0A229T3S2_9PSEU|nr:glyoxalase [Amycolatopsis vastitatis]